MPFSSEDMRKRRLAPISDGFATQQKTPEQQPTSQGAMEAQSNWQPAFADARPGAMAQHPPNTSFDTVGLQFPNSPMGQGTSTGNAPAPQPTINRSTWSQQQSPGMFIRPSPGNNISIQPVASPIPAVTTLNPSYNKMNIQPVTQQYSTPTNFPQLRALLNNQAGTQRGQ